MAVYFDSFALELGLGGSFRQTLIDESFVVGTWPLAEVKSTTARDITGNRNHGTYAGTGFTRGVTVPLPEGALGCTCDGNGQVDVPDDGLSLGLGLSLAAGSMDIVCLLKTTTNDANQRGIATKYTGTNGWFVVLINGGIRFGLVVGGVTVFDITRGSIADDTWHLVHCCYEPEQNRVRIFIDGSVSGAAGTGTTEPAYTAADVAIAGWSHVAAVATRFIGTLAYVMVGREGNPDLSASLQTTRSWTAVTADVRGILPIAVRYGISGVSVSDNVARTGTMTFALNNAATNSGGVLGYYSPGHANCRSGFQTGIPVRLSITYSGTTYYKFRGSVKSVKPLAGAYRARYVTVTCVDWMDVAASEFLSAVSSQVSQTSDHVFGIVVDQAERPPAAITLGAGSETFAYALDSDRRSDSPLLTEFARIVDSERGFIYQKGDTAQGGTLVYEGRQQRQTDAGLDATFNDTMHDLDVEYDLSRVINIVRVIVYPRTVDAAATTVLYSLPTTEADQPLAPGQTLIVEGAYRDPSQTAVKVGGTAMVTPVASTDYTMNTAADGSGTDLTSDFTVAADLGGNLARFTITNDHATSVGYITKLQARGKGIYHYDPITVESRDEDSVRKHGPRVLSIDMPYQSTVTVAQSVADLYLGLFANPVAVPTSMTLAANQTATLMTQALARELGDRVGVVEAVTGIVAADGHFINDVALEIRPGKMLTTAWTLATALPTGFWMLGEAGYSELGDTTVLGF